MLAEIQQQSDITYRFYDWNRMNDLGRPRALHVEKALRVTDFSALDTHTIRPLPIFAEAYDRYCLVACRYFAWERLDLRTCTPELSLDKFQLLSVIAGAADVTYGDRYSHSVRVRHGHHPGSDDHSARRAAPGRCGALRGVRSLAGGSGAVGPAVDYDRGDLPRAAAPPAGWAGGGRIVWNGVACSNA